MDKQKTAVKPSAIGVRFFVITIICLLPKAATDLYLPSLTAMAHYFSVTINMAEWSIALYLVGMAISQLIYGPLSEGFGRKKPLLAGLSISLVGCLVCLFAQNIESLLLGRLIQGFGAGACACLFRAILRDVFKGPHLVQYVSYLVIINSAIVPAVPVFGGYLQHYFHWQASFSVLLAYTAFVLVVVMLALPESHHRAHRGNLRLSVLRAGFSVLLKSRLFMGYSICAAFAAGATFAWVTNASVLLMKGAGLSPIIFGWTMLLTSLLPVMFAGWLNPRLIKKIGTSNVLTFAWSVMVISGVLFILFHYFWPFSAFSIIVPASLFLFSSMFVFPNTFTLAFAPFGHIAGLASTLYATIQMAGAGIFSAMFAHFTWVTPVPLGWVLILLGCVSWCVFTLGLKKVS